ncbi:hypothetical protein A4X13_0g7324 [Tilletia indica]|uniref:Uncharacterized protein n=1 Tax=Tilletia indica TaxID=43049 RepID=A0A177T4W2_9BASI|nr:hypothetical protein A4X13_0g7324 [Tilletia indica]
MTSYTTATTHDGTTMQLESGAASRFFATPELVKVLLEFFSRDRVDLLTLAMVSKTIRIQALRVWARYLDLPVSAASRRFKFLKANTDMLAHIRYVRIRSDGRENGIFGSTIGYSTISNIYLSSILEMIANRRSRALSLPLLDVTLSPEDSIRIPRALMKRVVALRIISSPVHFRNGVFEPPGQRRNLVRSIEARDSTENELVRPWDKLAELIQTTSEGPGLHTFEICEPDEAADDIDVDGYFRCWSLLIEHHVRTLQSLSVTAEPGHIPKKFSTVSFPHLRDFQLLQYNCNSELLQGFLDHHTNLRRLQIECTQPSEPFVEFSQTFPNLSDIYMTAPFPGPEFAERHPRVIRNIKHVLLQQQNQDDPEFETSTEYPNQRFACFFDSESLQQMVAAGQLLSHIQICDLGKFGQTLNDYLQVLTARPKIAQAVTCLELEASDPNLGALFRSFDPTIFENLAEVSIALNLGRCAPSYWNTYVAGSVESIIASAISHFVPSRSLRVLRIDEGQARCSSTNILLNHEFPPALEYFGSLEPPTRVPQYFRFVSSDPFGRVVKTESGGKRGRLQRVPIIFRAKITPYGVWERPLESTFQNTVLDHISGPPTLVLS